MAHPDERARQDEGHIPKQSFQGLSDYRLDLGKSRRLIDDDYLKSAFGITMSRRGSDEHARHERRADAESIPDVPPLPRTEIVASPKSEKSEFFAMDVPLALDPRGMLLPHESDGETNFHDPSAVDARAASDSDEPASTVSSVSTLKQARLAQQLKGDTATAVAVISPDQVLESPKPRRPFSTVSIEGITNVQPKKATPEQPIKSAASNSSEDTNGPDVQLSEPSIGSSMSSVVSQFGSGKPAEPEHQPERRYLISGADLPTPLTEDEDATPLATTMDVLPPLNEVDDATNMYHTALTSHRHSRSAASMKRIAPHAEARRQNSDLSLAISFASPPPNVNKPLPPEPGRRAGVLSHISEQSSSPKSSSTSLRQESQQQQQQLQLQQQQHQRSRTMDESPTSPQSSRAVGGLQRIDSRVSTLSGWSLRSKYSPKDLDALDNAFVQRDRAGGRSQSELSPSYHSPPQTTTGGQFSLNDTHLAVIREASPRVRPGPDGPRHHKQSLSDPFQRSRGPLRSESGRHGPYLASSKSSTRKNSLISLYNEKSAQKPPTQRSQSSAQISTQPKLNETPNRATTILVGTPSSKAERILGKSNGESIWPVQESLGQQSTPPGRDQYSPPTEQPRDAHFAEIEKRMQILHPKEEAHEVQIRNGPASSNLLQPRGDGRWKRVTPLAELPAQRSPQIGGTDEESGLQPAELDGSGDVRHEDILIQHQQFVPPPPPPPPLSTTPPLAADRRGRKDGADPASITSAKSRSTPSHRSMKVRSIASLVASEIPDIYACLPSNATNSLRPSMTAEEAEQMISAEAAERVLYRILQNLETFRDLFAAAQVSRGFYRTFKRHELSLLKSALRRMSPPAWELREISIPRLELLEDGTDYMPNLYFSHYVRDMDTVTELKGLILEHCKPFLRAETVQVLTGGAERQTKIDSAFWRVWTFCKIFGGGSHREHDMAGQLDWLKGGSFARESFERRKATLADEPGRKSILINPPAGFAGANGDGLNSDELYDMTEIWTCLGVLVQGYLERPDLAWEYGVFDRVNISRGDRKPEKALLEEWTYYLMSRGPQAILRAAAPTAPSEKLYSRIQADGLTDWKPLSNGSSRSMFLKEALSHVYDEQMRETRPLMAASPKGFSDLPQVVSPSMANSFAPNAMNRGSHYRPMMVDTRSVNLDPALAIMNVNGGYAPAAAVPVKGPTSAPMGSYMMPSMNAPAGGPIANEPLSAPMSNFHETLSKLESIDTSIEKASGPASAKANRTKLTTRRRARTGEAAEQRTQRINLEAVMSPTSTADSHSPVTPSPGANTFKTPHKTPRLATLKSKVTGKAPRMPTSAGVPGRSFGFKASEVSLPSMPSIDNVSINTQSDTLASRGSGDQVEDPTDPMIEKLVAMGFEEAKARKALHKNTKHNFIDFEKALASLVKQREARKKLERLDRMG